MEEIIQKLLAQGKGILAADARIKSMGKRLEAIGVSPTPENALKFRGTLFNTPGISEFIGGIILNDDTVKSSLGGNPSPNFLLISELLRLSKLMTGLNRLGRAKKKLQRGSPPCPQG